MLPAQTSETNATLVGVVAEQLYEDDQLDIFLLDKGIVQALETFMLSGACDPILTQYITHVTESLHLSPEAALSPRQREIICGSVVIRWGIKTPPSKDHLPQTTFRLAF